MITVKFPIEASQEEIDEEVVYRRSMGYEIKASVPTKKFFKIIFQKYDFESKEFISGEKEKAR